MGQDCEGFAVSLARTVPVAVDRLSRSELKDEMAGRCVVRVQLCRTGRCERRGDRDPRLVLQIDEVSHFRCGPANDFPEV